MFGSTHPWGEMPTESFMREVTKWTATASEKKLEILLTSVLHIQKFQPLPFLRSSKRIEQRRFSSFIEH